VFSFVFSIKSAFNQPLSLSLSLSLYLKVLVADFSSSKVSGFILFFAFIFCPYNMMMVHLFMHIYIYLVRITNMEDDSSRMFLRALVIMAMLCFSFSS